MCYRFQEYNQDLADGLAEFFRVSIAEVPRNCLTFCKRGKSDDGMEDKEKGRGRFGGRSTFTKVSKQKLPRWAAAADFERNAQQQMPKKSNKGSDADPKSTQQRVLHAIRTRGRSSWTR